MLLMNRLTTKSPNPSQSSSPVAAGLAVVASDTGRVLMIQRPLKDGDPNAGKWEFPGGRIEDGETPVDAALREWQEEVGLEAPGYSRSNGLREWRSSNGKYVGYVLSMLNGESFLDLNARDLFSDPDSEVGGVVAWVDPKDLPQHNLRPALLSDLDEVMAKVTKWLALRQVRKSRLSAGRSVSSFDQEQLAAGTKVEMEHTDDPTEARRIAMDHLVEDPCYYAKLRLIERGALVNHLKALYECKSVDPRGLKPGDKVKFLSHVGTVIDMGQYRELKAKYPQAIVVAGRDADESKFGWCFAIRFDDGVRLIGSLGVRLLASEVMMKSSPVNRLTRKASFFEECDRDEEGRCKPGKGGDGGESTQESKPQQPSSEQQAKARNHVVRSILSSAISIKDAAKGAASKVGQAVWDKLSPKAQERLAKTYQLAKAVEHKVMSGFRATNKLAMKAAEERGASPEVAARVGKILATVDMASAWTVNMPATLAVTGSASAAKVASWVPVASLAYLGYSTARNPFATVRAARGMVRDWKAGKHKSILRFVEKAVDQETLAGELTERLMKAQDPDKWAALFSVAFDELGDAEEAMNAADELSSPKQRVKSLGPVNRLKGSYFEEEEPAAEEAEPPDDQTLK